MISGTGKIGQNAASLVEKTKSRADIELIAAGRPELNLTDSISFAARVRPDIVVPAAACTATEPSSGQSRNP